MSGRLFGVGVGPGDPGLVTLRAAELVRTADVVAYHSGTHRTSIARGIAEAAGLLRDDVVEENLVYPVTTGSTDHPGGYAGALADFYDGCVERLDVHLAAGRDVVVLAEGDPLFYGSYMYLHDRLSPRYETRVVPGVTSVSAAAAAAASPLVRQTDVLTVLPGTLPEPELARRLADTEGAVVMKLGRTFAAVRRALEAAGRLDEAVYVERASTDREVTRRAADVDPDEVPYFSIVLVPGDTGPGRSRYDEPAAPVAARRPVAELLVVGLGPGPARWITPEATEALAGVDHVVGYGPYVERVPQRPGLTRHASGNTVELDRARLALDLARRGERVAVVSGGDAGVFGMATAVHEALEAAVAEDPAFADVPVRVLPGVSAVQAVAARAGAPVGGDFCVLSLSDRLKPWSVVERRVRAAAEADLVLAVYNPASRSRTTQVADLQQVLLEVRAPSTVVVVGRDVGRDGEQLEVTTLGGLDPATIDMRCLLLVGSSATRVGPAGVWTPRWVEDQDARPPSGAPPTTGGA